MTFTMQIDSISGGALRWFIVDPIGNTKWSGREEAAGTYASELIPASGGTWKVNVVSEADSVDYRLEWIGILASGEVTALHPSPCLGGNQ